ncbi:MAG TPA: dTDP-4-dehydrorhamnose 3,5-epimerase family protein [Candidatus Bathyarchaeia archaeon]|nr:dTDP-4-dehydrorhamnose 3,5-epimerase family protein [Candidatus Bathyarchaeia archaeon]
MEKFSFLQPISPTEIKIKDVKVVKRTIFYDQRGFLVETFAQSREKGPGVYAYASLVREGKAKDIDQYHFHQNQTDRMTIVQGVLWILLFDRREKSSTYGKLEVLEVKGADPAVKEKKEQEAFTIAIPPGVYHGIMAPGPGDSFLINHPSQEYDPKEEGRISFDKISVPSLEGGTFSWKRVKKAS